MTKEPSIPYYLRIGCERKVGFYTFQMSIRKKMKDKEFRSVFELGSLYLFSKAITITPGAFDDWPLQLYINSF